MFTESHSLEITEVADLIRFHSQMIANRGALILQLTASKKHSEANHIREKMNHAQERLEMWEEIHKRMFARKGRV